MTNYNSDCVDTHISKRVIDAILNDKLLSPDEKKSKIFQNLNNLSENDRILKFNNTYNHSLIS